MWNGENEAKNAKETNFVNELKGEKKEGKEKEKSFPSFFSLM